MLHFEDRFVGIDGLELYYQGWLPTGNAKAVLGIIHGLGSHSRLFYNLVKALVPYGYAVYAFDLRGHGQSPGQRGHINHWQEFRGDLHRFRQLIDDHHANLPCFLLGHSLGSIILMDYVLHNPGTVTGLITMAPAIGPLGVSPLRLKIGQILSRTWPRFSLKTGLDHNTGSHDPTIIAAYLHDPLRHASGTARLATEFLATIGRIQQLLDRWQTPTLILHGSDDRVVSHIGSRQLFEQLPIADKEYREYQGGYHDLHNDIYVPQVAEDMLNWLERQTQGNSALCQLNRHQQVMEDRRNKNV